LGIAALLAAAGMLIAEDAPSIDKLVEQLAAREVPVRREAAYQLSRLGPAAKPAVPALITALSDPDRQVWSMAVSVLADLGPDAADALPALIDNLDSKKNRGQRDRDKRQVLFRSAHAIARIGPVAIPQLIEALKSEDSMTRAGAAKALGGMGAAAREAVSGLVANLPRDPADERADTIEALALIGRDAVPALGEALGSNEPRTRSGAALALAQIGRDAASVSTPVAEATARETDPVARAALFSAVAKTGVAPARAVPLLMLGVVDDNEQVRHGAINAIHLMRSANDLFVPAFITLLRDPNPALRERAAIAVGRLGPAASGTVPVLLELARQSSPASTPFLTALGQIGPAAVPGILQAVETENPDTLTRELWSVQCLQTLGGEAVTPLTQALADSRTGVRLVAARALGELGPVAAPAFGALSAAASDTDPRVRATALAALVSTRVQALAAISRIEAALKDSVPVVRIAAAQLVPQLGEQSRPLAPALLAALNDPDSAVRLAVVQGLSAVGPAAEPAIDGLLKLLPTADLTARAHILTVFAAIGPAAKVTLPEVRARLGDPDAVVRAAAVAAFTKIEQAENRLPALLVALDDPELPVRKAAAQGLSGIGARAQSATGKLTALLQRDNERDFAFETLKQISVASVPDLITMLKDRDLAVKTFATQRLGRLGPEAKDAVPALEAILSGNERGELKRNVTEALKRIKP
jgi:HEAT repeat protein